jgi:RimJ/RimL family protein N-acetyltransferase
MTGWPTSAPVLSDGVVTLRAHRAADIDAVWAQCQDPQIQRWTGVPSPYERAHAEHFVTVALPSGWQAPLGTKGFAIEALDAGRPRFAGTVELRPDRTRGAEVGFGLAPWARGRGVMARALRTALRWAFGVAGADVVLWRAPVGNWASRRVAWACGFQVEGTVRGLLESRGVRSDGWVGSLRRGEEMQPRGPWLDVPEIRGGRVDLRPWRDEDTPRMVESCSDPLSRRWLPHLPRPYGPADAEAFLLRIRTGAAEGSALGWSLADPADGRSLGSLTLFGLDRVGHEAELGYLLHPDARGRGLMTAAVRMAVRHAVAPAADGGLGLPRLSLRAAARNVPSCRVAEAAGFRRLGVQRAVDPQPDGAADDLACYDLLAAEVTA